MKKRILSILLALCMLMSLLPIAAFAQDDAGDGNQGTTTTEPEFTAATANDAFAGKKAADVQSGTMSITKNTTSGKYEVSGVTLEKVTGWADFNKSLVSEQSGYYLAIAIPKTVGSDNIAGMILPGKDAQGKPVDKKYEDQTALNSAFSDGGNTKCNIFIHMGADAEAVKAKTFSVQLKYGEATAYSKYDFDFTKVNVETPTVAINAVPANLTAVDGQEAPAYGHATDYTTTLSETGQTKTITVKATNLGKTTAGTPDASGGTGTAVTDYWVGVGLTKQANVQYAWGFGTKPTQPVYKNVTRTQTTGEEEYVTMYWSPDTGKTWDSTESKTGYISVKASDGTVTDYTVKFEVTTVTPVSEGISVGFSWNGDDANTNINKAIIAANKSKTVSDSIDQAWWMLINADVTSGSTKYWREVKLNDTVVYTDASVYTGGAGAIGIIYDSFMMKAHEANGPAVKAGDTLTFTLKQGETKDAATLVKTETVTVPANPLKIATADATNIAEKEITVKFNDDLYGRYVIEVKKGDATVATMNTECDRGEGKGDAGKIAQATGAVLTADSALTAGTYTVTVRANVKDAPVIDTKTFVISSDITSITTTDTDVTVKADNTNHKIVLTGKLINPEASRTVPVTITTKYTATGETVTLNPDSTKLVVNYNDKATGDTPKFTCTNTVKILDTVYTVDVSGLEAINPQTEVVAPATKAETSTAIKNIVNNSTDTDLKTAVTNTVTAVQSTDAPDDADTVTTLKDAAKEEAVKITESQATTLKNDAVVKAGDGKINGVTPAADKVVLVTQSNLVVTVDNYEVDAATSNVTLTLDVSNVVRTVAHFMGDPTQFDGSDVKVKGDADVADNQATAVVVKEGVKKPVTQSVTFTVNVPATLISSSAINVWVKHMPDGKADHYHPATAEALAGTPGTTVLTITSTDGLSPFVIEQGATIAAKIGETGYVTLKAAIDAAKDDDIITLVSDNSEKITVTRAVSFTLDKASFNFTGSITAGTGYKNEGSADNYKFVRDGGGTPTGGGGGVSSNVTIDRPTNGKVTVTPTAPSKGATVTINLTPDTGYAVGTVTVTDKDGKAVELTKVSDTQYTFTMPDGKVTVKATFTKVDTPPTTGFTDVAADAYYADAVKWAVDNGITNGLTANTFGPNNSCTRGQMVTFLWRAAGSPAATGTNSFSDVASGEYYYNAVLWAVEKGITNGTSATTFSPNATVNRGQTVTFLYRYAESPAATGDTSFTDVAADAFYADAVKWAVAEGITNGTSDTTFAPASNCTRGQIVTFMYRQMAE